MATPSMVPHTAELHEEIRLLRQKLLQLRRRERRSQPLSKLMLVGVTGLVVQQRFPEQVDRVLEQLQRLVGRTRPLLQAGGQAAVAFTAQQTPRVSRLFGHVRGHGMRLLRGGHHNVQTAVQVVAAECNKRVRALQKARYGDSSSSTPPSKRLFPYDDDEDDGDEGVYHTLGGDSRFHRDVVQLLQRACYNTDFGEPPMESIAEEVEDVEEFEAAEAAVQAEAHTQAVVVQVEEVEQQQLSDAPAFSTGMFQKDVAALLTSLQEVQTMQRLQEAGSTPQEDVVDVETLKYRVERLKDRAEKVRSMMHAMQTEDASKALEAVEAAEAAAETEEERVLREEACAQKMAAEAKAKLDAMLSAQRTAQRARVASLSLYDELPDETSTTQKRTRLTPRTQGKIDSDSQVSPNLLPSPKPRNKPAWSSNTKVSPQEEAITMTDVNAVIAEMTPLPEDKAVKIDRKEAAADSYISWLGLPPWVGV